MAVQCEQSSCCCSRCDSILSASWCHLHGDLAKLAHACQTFLCAVQIVYEGNSVIIQKSVMHFACNVYVDTVFVVFFYLFVFCFFNSLVGCLSLVVWTLAVLGVLYASVMYFCICTCSAQLSMFHMERRSRNMLIIIIIINFGIVRCMLLETFFACTYVYACI